MLRIGIDDTDSLRGGCTTYIAALLKDALAKYSKATTLRLVRLNPNAPWKTRGNGSVLLEVETEKESEVKELVLRVVEEYSMIGDDNTNPGVAFYDGELTKEFRDFYRRALTGIVKMEEADAIASDNGVELHKYGNGRGVIGALAAIGSHFEDATYEIMAYRTRGYWGTARMLDLASVYEMNAATYPRTFNNVDPEERRVLITPRSPCPVFYGIRGEDIDTLRTADSMLRVGEPVERKALFYTNQCTDAHLVGVERIADIEPYSSVMLKGTIEEKPRATRGGHVFASLSDSADSIIIAAFEPTKGFREIVLKLAPGDEVRAYGAVKPKNGFANGRMINLEKLEVLGLPEKYDTINPRCPVCGRRMESAGSGQGLRCRWCKTYSQSKERVEVRRELRMGLYSVPPCAMRHLSKPLCRFEADNGTVRQNKLADIKMLEKK